MKNKSVENHNIKNLSKKYLTNELTKMNYNFKYFWKFFILIVKNKRKFERILKKIKF